VVEQAGVRLDTGGVGGAFPHTHDIAGVEAETDRLDGWRTPLLLHEPPKSSRAENSSLAQHHLSG
jgi:hypothetical protein